MLPDHMIANALILKGHTPVVRDIYHYFAPNLVQLRYHADYEEVCLLNVLRLTAGRSDARGVRIVWGATKVCPALRHAGNPDPAAF